MNYTTYTFSGIRVHVASDDISNLRLVQSRGVKYPLSQFFLNGSKPTAIANCSYFTSTYVIGRNQGDISQDTSSYNDKGWLGFAIKQDGTYSAGKLEWWDVEKSTCGFTPACICILNGQKTELCTSELAGTYAKKMALGTAVTFFGILNDKRTCLLITGERGLSGNTLVNEICKKYTFDFLCALDGGGSSEMIVNGVIKQKSTDGSERKMFNGLCFVKGATVQAPVSSVGSLNSTIDNLNNQLRQKDEEIAKLKSVISNVKNSISGY